MKSIEEKIAVMQAFADGKQIQIKLKSGNKWSDYLAEEPQWDWTIFDYRVKPENHLPTTWEDFCNNYPIKEGEAFINYCSKIREYQSGETRDAMEDKYLLPNRRYAEAMLALCQLIQLRDCYNEGWQPNWEDTTSKKYIIGFYLNEIIPCVGSSSPMFLAFKTEELRDKFLKNFKDLIEIAKFIL